MTCSVRNSVFEEVVPLLCEIIGITVRRQKNQCFAMAMQTAVVYGRLFVSHAREVIGPLFRKEAPSRFRLIAACCGFSKDISNTHQKFSFGEDAYFMTESRFANVLGMWC